MPVGIMGHHGAPWGIMGRHWESLGMIGHHWVPVGIVEPGTHRAIPWHEEACYIELIRLALDSPPGNNRHVPQSAISESILQLFLWNPQLLSHTIMPHHAYAGPTGSTDPSPCSVFMNSLKSTTPEPVAHKPGQCIYESECCHAVQRVLYRLHNSRGTIPSSIHFVHELSKLFLVWFVPHKFGHNSTDLEKIRHHHRHKRDGADK